jgi:NTP pyrophosphatase (non-canonical NTP hydrolase)
MTLKEYEEFVESMFRQDLTTDQLIANMSMGLAGESGELIDLLKKDLFHNVPADATKLLLELGDTLFYVTALTILAKRKWAEDRRWSAGDAAVVFSVPNALRANVSKLRRRYPDKFVVGGGIRD